MKRRFGALAQLFLTTEQKIINDNMNVTIDDRVIK